MKGIKQYFTNGRNIVKETDSNNIVEQEEQEQEETGKRKRVKIWISRNDSANRMCDILESKNDLIDKTPSPFNGEQNNGNKILQDGTPRSGLAESAVKQNVDKVSVLLKSYKCYQFVDKYL